MNKANPSEESGNGPVVAEDMGLAEQAAFLTSILESSTEYAIVAKDLNGRILAWNEGAHQIYGYGPSEVVGKAKAFILDDPADVASGRAQGILDEARQTGKWEGEMVRIRKNHERFNAYVTITLRRDKLGKPIGFTAVSRDLTGAQRGERHLREFQEYNRSLIESNIDALMITDPLGVITDVNKQMCEMTGYSREELIHSTVKRYFTDANRAEDGIREVLAEDRVINYELTLRSKAGRETLVSYNATTFRAADGKLRGVFAAVRDIADQKLLEDQLRQAQNYTRGLIEASLDALIMVGPDSVITDVNDETIRFTGYTREELIGSPFSDYFTDPARATAGVQKTLSESFVTNYELVLRSKADLETLVSFNASVFRDTEGKIRGIFVSARDITEQRRLEEELLQARNYTRGLIESSVDPMITVFQDFTISDANEQMVRLTGVPKATLIGTKFNTYFTEPDRAAAGVRKTLNEGSVTNYELTLNTPSGSEVLVSFNASIFKDTEGNVRGIFAVARDVTEQRRLEQQLLEQQNYSRGLIEASVDALVTVDPSGRITGVNDRMIRLTGFPRNKLEGSPFADYFTDPVRAAAGVRKTFDEDVVKNYELVVKTKAGSESEVSFYAAVFKDTAGRVAGIYAAIRDIIDQKRLEEALREQQTYTRGLYESNIDALMTTDSLGVITDVNKQMSAVTGHAPEELIGTPFKDYFTDPKRAEDGIRKVLAEGRVTNYELTIRAKDGKETMVSYNATTFTGRDGKLRGVFAAARDITDQKRLEEELRQAQNYSRGLIESSVDAMLTVAPDLTIIEVNKQMVRLTGFTRDQLIGSAFRDYFSEPDRATSGVEKTLKDGFVTNYELTLRSRHRREILVSFNASVFKDTGGTVRGIFAVARDVTEQRRLEEQLQDQQNYNRGLIESYVDALLMVAPDLTITDVNEQTVRLTGYSREELVGSYFRDYFTDPEKAANGVHEALSRGSVTNYELVLKSNAGKRTMVSFNAGTFKDTSGRVAGILAAAREITAQKRLEDQLRDQQNYSRSLIESSVDALMIVDPNGVITDVNEQSVRLTGYNRKLLIGSPFVNYFTDPDRALRGVQKTFEDNSVSNYELLVRSKSGRKNSVSFNAAVFRDTSGEIGGILAAARDVTEYKQIEQKIREQQTYTRGLIESNIDALMTTDTLGIITDVNLQMCAATGRTREELIGTPFKDYFTDPDRAENGIRQVLIEDKVTNYELTIQTKDGKGTLVSYNATTFKGADGRLRGVFAAARDITDQKILEEKIRKQNSELTETTTFLNNVLESSIEHSIIAIDLDGKILAWNEGAKRNYGYSQADAVGKLNTRILHTVEDIGSGRVQAMLDTALSEGKSEGVFDHVRNDGKVFTASVAVSLRRDSSGQSVGYLFISKDITDQKVLEEQLRRKNEELQEQNRRVQEANRLKSEFLANMSHELRTPLNGIIGFSELMFNGKVGPMADEHKEYLGDILTGARHLLHLINDVLDLAKVESGKVEIHPEQVSLLHLASEVKDLLATMADQKNIRVDLQVGPGLDNVVLDSGKFKQILYNYLSNALKFTPEGGKVQIRFSPQGKDDFLLEVEDNGIGISKKDMDRLFIEFEQLDSGTSKKYAGTGLGLALTKRIVEYQGGKVGVSSREGHGSTFSAILPLSLNANARRMEDLPSARPAGQRSILVVEDDVQDMEWIVKTLTLAGFSVDQAATGKDAILKCRERRYDAITLDLILPDLGGWGVLREIRNAGLNADTPIIAVTVAAQRSAIAAFRIHDLLPKPITKVALLDSLESAGLAAGKKVLVVNDDPQIVKMAELAIKKAGWVPLTATDGESGLLIMGREAPSAVVLDLMMPEMNGYDFLTRMRELPFGREVAVFVWTAKTLTGPELKLLQARVKKIVPIGDGGTSPLLEELRCHLKEEPNPAAISAA